MRIVTHSCSNCGLPDAHYTAQVSRKAENKYQRETCVTLWFCGKECAMQTIFLGLEKHSTAGSVVRFFAGQPVSYAEFRQLAGPPHADETRGRQIAGERRETLF